MFTTIILIFVLSTILTLGLTPGVITIAKKFGLVDNPSVRPHPAHTHTNIIPRAGGLSIFFGIFAACKRRAQVPIIKRTPNI